MSLGKSYEAYGRYLVTWDRLNAVLDAAIVKETRLSAAHGALLVGHLTAKTRLGVLRSLLAMAGGEKADAVPLLVEIAQDAKRQPMLQGAVTVGPADSLSFQRADLSLRLGGSVVSYGADEIDGLADELARRIDGLAAVLAVTEADLAQLRQAASVALAKRGKRERESEDADA